nr:hypothetical protein [Tanacetum cinerariifolium]
TTVYLQVDVYNDLSKPLTTHYFPKEREAASAKPHHMIASSNSRITSKNMPRFSFNDMVYNHYLEEAKKNTQERSRNSEPILMPSARSQNTANGSKPKPRINNQNSRNWPASKSSCVTTKTMPIVEHSRNSRNLSDSKHIVCLKCQKCVFNANHDSCVTKFLKEVNSRDKVPSNKITYKNKPVEQISVPNKQERHIPTRHRWKPSGRIFKTVGLRWIPTGKIFASSITKVDNEPLNGSNVDFTNQYECEQTLDGSAGCVLSWTAFCQALRFTYLKTIYCILLRINSAKLKTTLRFVLCCVLPQNTAFCRTLRFAQKILRFAQEKSCVLLKEYYVLLKSILAFCQVYTAFCVDSQMHNNIMVAGSRDHPPMLAPGRYPQWRSRDDIYSNVDACQTAQEMWEAIERLQQGKRSISLTTSTGMVKNKNVDMAPRYKNDDHSGQFGNQRTTKQAEFEKFKAFNDRTVDYEKFKRKLNEALGQLAHKDTVIREGTYGVGATLEGLRCRQSYPTKDKDDASGSTKGRNRPSALQRNASIAKDDLRKALDECNDIPQEKRALTDTFLKQKSDKGYEMHNALFKKVEKNRTSNAY